MTDLSLTNRYKYKLKAFKIRRAARLELHDLLFHHDSAVLMPGPALGSSPGLSGLQLLVVCFEYAEDNPDKVVLVAGTLDTKGDELRYMRDLIRAAGLPVRLVDLSTSGGHLWSL